jgi:hypothetical protein
MPAGARLAAARLLTTRQAYLGKCRYLAHTTQRLLITPKSVTALRSRAQPNEIC